MTRIAVVGGGRIGEALIAGLLEAGRPVTDLVVVETHADRARFLAERFSIRVTEAVAEAAVAADLIVIAVKPADVVAVLDALHGALGTNGAQVVVSLAAGVPTTQLEGQLPTGCPVVRVMPNTPMLVGAGMSVLTSGRFVTAEQVAVVSEMLSAVGEVAEVAEAQMDAVTAISGSGPAYFFLMVEALTDAGVGLGLPRKTATQLVVQTLVGSAALLAESGQEAVDLRAAVTSPGGTTAAALRELERGGVRSVFLEAAHAAQQRSAAQGAAG